MQHRYWTRFAAINVANQVAHFSFPVLPYLYTSDRRIKWRMIIAVIYIRNVYNCDDHPSFNSSLRSSHIWFSYIVKFIIILSRICNEPIQRPTPIWLVSLSGRALHRYRRGKGFESRTSLNFFQTFFSQLQKLRI